MVEKLIHITTEKETEEIVKGYWAGETLTSSVLKFCKIPRDAENMKFVDDIFEPGCRISYEVIKN